MKIIEEGQQGALRHKKSLPCVKTQMLKNKMWTQEFSQKKKKDMPIKKLLLKIWLAASFPSPMDTLSKENMVGFFLPWLYLISN